MVNASLGVRVTGSGDALVTNEAGLKVSYNYSVYNSRDANCKEGIPRGLRQLYLRRRAYLSELGHR